MTNTSALWSPTAWLNSAHVEHWLRSLWPTWRSDDVRHDWDDQDRWYWMIADFDRGRSRVLGIGRELLERTTVTKLRQVLEAAHWMARIDREALLVDRTSDGEWSVEAWKPPLEEKWFEDPAGGFFVAFHNSGALVSSAPPPARLPRPFLALHGKTWSAMGPKDPRPAQTYSVAELLPYLPKSRTTAS